MNKLCLVAFLALPFGQSFASPVIHYYMDGYAFLSDIIAYVEEGRIKHVSTSVDGEESPATHLVECRVIEVYKGADLLKKNSQVVIEYGSHFRRTLPGFSRVKQNGKVETPESIPAGRAIVFFKWNPRTLRYRILTAKVVSEGKAYEYKAAGSFMADQLHLMVPENLEEYGDYQQANLIKDFRIALKKSDMIDKDTKARELPQKR